MGTFQTMYRILRIKKNSSFERYWIIEECGGRPPTSWITCGFSLKMNSNRSMKQISAFGWNQISEGSNGGFRMVNVSHLWYWIQVGINASTKWNSFYYDLVFDGKRGEFARYRSLVGSLKDRTIDSSKASNQNMTAHVGSFRDRKWMIPRIYNHNLLIKNSF